MEVEKDLVWAQWLEVISMREGRFSRIPAEVRGDAYIAEAVDELSGIRLELAALRQILERLTYKLAP